MKKYLELMRIKHYIKNLLIFFPLIFSGNAFNSQKLINVIYAFIAFSLTSSIVYIINDIKDKEKDKLHEKKKNRPIASGQVSISKALIVVLLLILMTIFFEYLAESNVTQMSYIYILVYIFINLLYSFGLKDIPLVDVAILAAGFLLRTFYGANIIGVDISNWFYLTIMAVALYLGLGKRRNEIVKSGINTRKVLKYYNKEFLDKNMYMCLSIAIVFYSLWSIDSTSNQYLVLTVPLIIFILMKYSMDIENDSYGDPVEVVLNDKILIAMIFLYGIILLGIIYL